MTRIDLSLNLSASSMAVLALLEDAFETITLDAYEHPKLAVADLEPIEIHAGALYNVKERGVCLRVDVELNRHDSQNPKLLIFFAEGHISHGLFVRWIETKEPLLNPPVAKHFVDAQHEAFGDDLVRAARFICNIIGHFYKRCMDTFDSQWLDDMKARGLTDG